MTESTPSETSSGFERRRQIDRRKDSRSGKRDRRNNLCGICVFYASQNSEKGLCQKHQKTVEVTEFACVLFKAKDD